MDEVFRNEGSEAGVSSTFRDHLFVSMLREEGWLVDSERSIRTSSHLETGHASTTHTDGKVVVRAVSGLEIRDLSSWIDLSRADLENRLTEPLQTLEPDIIKPLLQSRGQIKIRIRSDSRLVSTGNIARFHDATTITVAVGRDGHETSIVTTPSSLREDLARTMALLSRGSGAATAPASLPILWTNGSAAVLMHELIGHPSEENWPLTRLPEWLEVRDDPFSPGPGHAPYDDTGQRGRTSVLSDGGRPSSLRRESFRDPPILRMTHLTVTQNGAPLPLPEVRIEVSLVDGGGWDRLTDEISLRVATAEIVEGTSRKMLAPFSFKGSRGEIASRIIGANADSVRYPGVICSREGQRLAVGSSSVDLLVSGGAQ
ncbi:MAG TPA: hypothetical protein VNM92_17165 [Thermoanaerobaculia bacterium]|nr:hypothetical protein [Thermoanaerobaculia bacterium]